MEELKKQLTALSSELGEHELDGKPMANTEMLRQRATIIAGIGFRHFKGMLLHRCVGIATAIAEFADELETPGD